MKLRVEAEDPNDTTWPTTCQYSHAMISKFGISLHNIKDSDEVWIFYEGDLGWKTKQETLCRKKTSATVRATPSTRAGVTANIVSTANGRLLKPLVLGEVRNFGTDTDKGRKLKRLR